MANRGYAAADAVTQQALRRWGEAPDDALLGGRSEAYLRSSGQAHDLEFVLAHIDDLGGTYVVTPELELAVSG